MLLIFPAVFETEGGSGNRTVAGRSKIDPLPDAEAAEEAAALPEEEKAAVPPI